MGLNRIFKILIVALLVVFLIYAVYVSYSKIEWYLEFYLVTILIIDMELIWKFPNYKSSRETRLDEATFSPSGEGLRISFPSGDKLFGPKFNKMLLKVISDEIQQKIPGMIITWFSCKPPLVISKYPSNCIKSDFLNGNRLVIELRGKIILESFSYKAGTGSIFIFDKCLNDNEIEIISEIFKKNGIKSIEEKKVEYDKLKKQLSEERKDLPKIEISFLYVLHVFFLVVYSDYTQGIPVNLLLVILFLAGLPAVIIVTFVPSAYFNKMLKNIRDKVSK
jgi:hypothetical protein